jgi:hypothetical protein
MRASIVGKGPRPFCLRQYGVWLHQLVCAWIDASMVPSMLQARAPNGGAGALAALRL